MLGGQYSAHGAVHVARPSVKPPLQPHSEQWFACCFPLKIWLHNPKASHCGVMMPQTPTWQP